MTRKPTRRQVPAPKVSTPAADTKTLFGIFVGTMLGYGLAKGQIKPVDAIALGTIIVKPEAADAVMKVLDEHEKRQLAEKQSASDAATDTSPERPS